MYVCSIFRWVTVASGERRIPAHIACPEHERGWETEDNVCPHVNQGYWEAIR